VRRLEKSAGTARGKEHLIILPMRGQSGVLTRLQSGTSVRTHRRWRWKCRSEGWLDDQGRPTDAWHARALVSASVFVPWSIVGLMVLTAAQKTSAGTLWCEERARELRGGVWTRRDEVRGRAVLRHPSTVKRARDALALIGFSVSEHTRMRGTKGAFKLSRCKFDRVAMLRRRPRSVSLQVLPSGVEKSRDRADLSAVLEQSEVSVDPPEHNPLLAQRMMSQIRGLAHAKTCAFGRPPPADHKERLLEVLRGPLPRTPLDALRVCGIHEGRWWKHRENLSQALHHCQVPMSSIYRVIRASTRDGVMSPGAYLARSLDQLVADSSRGQRQILKRASLGGDEGRADVPESRGEVMNRTELLQRHAAWKADRDGAKPGQPERGTRLWRVLRWLDKKILPSNRTNLGLAANFNRYLEHLDAEKWDAAALTLSGFQRRVAEIKKGD